MRIGILGGTFDPIHIGHLFIAEEARLRLDFEEVLFIPTGQPWMKGERSLSNANDRFNMVRLAIECNPFFRASSLEIDRSGPTYTVDTLRELHRQIGPGVDLNFIIGMDSLRWFMQWKEPAEVLELCKLAVVSRPGCEEYDFQQLDSVTPGGSDRVLQVPAPLLDVSGTRIRDRVAKGKSIRYQVPNEVERYIWTHGLYRGKRGGSEGG